MPDDIVTITASPSRPVLGSTPNVPAARGRTKWAQESDACAASVDHRRLPPHAFAASRRLVGMAMLFAAGLMAACNSHRAGESTATSRTAGAEISADGVPAAGELDAFVTGAGRVRRLGMTEKEVRDVLGTPNRRHEAASIGDSTDVAWDHVEGPRPGAALGRFDDGKLVYIEFVTTAMAVPHVDLAVATALTTAEIVQRSVAKQLRMADIEAVTRTPGQRMGWTIGRDGNRPTVSSRWAWEIDPGGDLLIVEERDGFAGQPIIRKKS